MTPAAATVLVVDDNRLNLELVTDVLAGAGYSIRQAASAEEALEAARAEHHDMILMDIGLPGMDGYAAVRALKDDPATRDILTVALTAAAMAGDQERALRSGFDGYIAKPIQTRTLARTVGQLLEGKEKP